jgi:hypothetical protein
MTIGKISRLYPRRTADLGKRFEPSDEWPVSLCTEQFKPAITPPHETLFDRAQDLTASVDLL